MTILLPGHGPDGLQTGDATDFDPLTIGEWCGVILQRLMIHGQTETAAVFVCGYDPGDPVNHPWQVAVSFGHPDGAPYVYVQLPQDCVLPGVRLAAIPASLVSDSPFTANDGEIQ